MSGGAGSVVERTNRPVRLAEGAAHLVHPGETAGRLAKRLLCPGAFTGVSQAGFFYTQAAREFAKPSGGRGHGWEAVGGCFYK